MDDLVADGQGADDGLQRPGGPHGVADHGLGRADRHLIGVLAEDLLDGHGLGGVVEGGAGAVGVDVVHLLGRNARIGQGLTHGQDGPPRLGVGRGHVVSIGVGGLPQHLGVDGGAAP